MRRNSIKFNISGIFYLGSSAIPIEIAPSPSVENLTSRSYISRGPFSPYLARESGTPHDSNTKVNKKGAPPPPGPL